MRCWVEMDKAKFASLANLAKLLILLLAFALRIYRLGDKNVWWDEGLAVWAVRKGLPGVTLWTAGDVHPPLYFWCLWAWRQLVGESEFALRYLTLMFGVLTVAALYPLGQRLAGRRVALLGMLLLAIARFHVWWSQEMRMYMLAGLMSTLAWYFLLRAIRRQSPNPSGTPLSRFNHRSVGAQTSEVLANSSAALTTQGDPETQDLAVCVETSDVFRGWPEWFRWTLYVLTATAAMYTIYLSVSSLIAQNLFVLAVGLGRDRRERWRLWRSWVVAQLTVLLLFAPWLALSVPRMQSWSVAQAPVSLKFVMQLAGTLFTLGISTYLSRYVWLVLPFAVICLVGLALLLGQNRLKVRTRGRLDGWQAGVLFLLALGIPPLSAWLLTQPRAVFYTPRIEARYFVPFAPLFYLLLGWSLLLIMQKSRTLSLLGLAFTVATFSWTLPEHYRGRYLHDELQTMVRTIWAYARPGDAVLLVSGNRYPLFHYYYDRDPAPDHRPPVYQLPRLAQIVTPETAARELEAALKDHRRLWLASVEAAIQDPQGLLEGWLDGHRVGALSLALGSNKLKLYTDRAGQLAVPPENLAPQHPLDIEPAQGVRLWGYDLPVREYGPHDTVHLALYWSLSEPAEAVVALIKEPGQLWEERQVTLQPLEEGILRTQFDFTIWPRSPAGGYHFDVDLQQGSSAVLPPSQRTSLGRFQVRGTKPLPEVRGIPHPMAVNLDDGIAFLGYGLQKKGGASVERARPGDVLALDLYWRATEKVSQRYTVFTHLVGTAYNPKTLGPVWAQHDGEPVDGGFPTHQWPVGTIVKDSHELQIDEGAPAGEYWLEVGLYLLDSGERLRVLGEDGREVDDRILLQSVQVGSW